ncbi:hypothetical protein R3W88_034083 [Solanum pinnatisectum]|uniref:CCHC-type domain-containing protein n=1 Tax=Solanum pinnatisectum TaxID=50273 RepID=A0AAV9K0Y9_9SOLN|nr:hypothetical protein R3W88_034083 [Solanum pinnatisectum]
MASRLRDFTRMNPPMFFGSKVNEDPQEFVEEDNRVIRAGPITWEVFKNAFLDRFFPREKREAKKECRAAMLHDNMDISRLMVYAQQVEESKLRKKNRDVKRARSDDGNSSKGKFEGQSGPRFKKRFSNQSSSNAPKTNKDRVSNPKPQGGNMGRSSMERPTCDKCDKKHEGKCLGSMGVCYGCGKSGHQLKYCPTRTTKGREGNQAPPSGSNSDAPKKNIFYALQS